MTETPVPEEREPNPAEQSATSEAPPAPEPTPEATDGAEPAAAPEPTPQATDAAEPAAAPEPTPQATDAAEPAQTDGAAPAPEQPSQPATPSRPQRPRRRRLSAAERHRRTFFAKLTELRKAEQAALAGGPEPTDEPAPEAAADGQPAPQDGEAPAPDPQPQQQAPEAPATSPSRSARAQARLVAAIERVGGAEAVLEALQPKRRDDGETMKWSSVCAEQAQGHRPGDPIFTAWVRLAATPVRDVKAIVNPRGRDDDRRGGRRGRGGGGNYRGGGGYGGGRGDRGDRGGRGARREDIESHGRDGSFRSSVRIVMVDADGQRKETDDPQEAIEAAERVAGENS
jgi:hypothetical protein